MVSAPSETTAGAGNTAHSPRVTNHHAHMHNRCKHHSWSGLPLGTSPWARHTLAGEQQQMTEPDSGHNVGATAMTEAGETVCSPRCRQGMLHVCRKVAPGDSTWHCPWCWRPPRPQQGRGRWQRGRPSPPSEWFGSPVGRHPRSRTSPAWPLPPSPTALLARINHELQAPQGSPTQTPAGVSSSSASTYCTHTVPCVLIKKLSVALVLQASLCVPNIFTQHCHSLTTTTSCAFRACLSWRVTGQAARSMPCK